jgi:hypothetical protein
LSLGGVLSFDPVLVGRGEPLVTGLEVDFLISEGWSGKKR